MQESSLISIDRVSKSYGGTHALRNVSLQVAAGEVHAICGENGAGKSTLIKILTGAVRPDRGQVLVANRVMPLGNIQAAEAAGIAVMHQESTAFPDLNAIDNLFVGRELTRLGGWLLRRRAMRRQAKSLLDRLGETIDLDLPVGQLPLAQRQMVAMARALVRDCRLLIMDEPTASLSARETDVLLSLIRQFRDQGVSVLYVSHRLEEIFAVADRVTVLRDGQLVQTWPVGAIDTNQLIHAMVGREVQQRPARAVTKSARQPTVLEVKGLHGAGRYHDISFAVQRGEILGLAGLVGAGRSELARALFGVDSYNTGCVTVEGRPLTPHSVPAAMTAGLALVPEDRQHEGLVLPMSVAENLSLPLLPFLKRRGIIDRRRERELVDRQMRDLQIRAAHGRVPAETLSGGNQQKVVLGKWLASAPRVLILDEPTRGVDVGAKAQVHQLVRQLADAGLATILISSELPELLALSDRILVMRSGRIVGELSGQTATQEDIMQLALPDVAPTATSNTGPFGAASPHSPGTR